jgi:outer membrane lipoprotein
VLVACASTPQIPAQYLEQVDRDVTYAQLKNDLSSYQGRHVVLSGEVLQVRRLNDRTQIEILHLPQSDALEPVLNPSASGGRFVAWQKDFLDPAILRPGTPVTVVGKVTGTTTDRFSDMDYTYPTLEIGYLKIWTLDQLSYAGNRAYYGYYGYPYYYPPFYDGYPYYSPFFGRPFFRGRPSPEFPHQSPHQFRPPAGRLPSPPQFRRR